MRGRQLSFAGAFIWTFAVAALMLAGGAVLGAAAPGALHDMVTVGALQAVALLLGTVGVLRVHVPSLETREAFGLRYTSALLSVLGLALGLVLHLPTQSLMRLTESLSPPSAEEVVQRTLLFEVSGTADSVALVLVAACIIPLTEELFFRGALFGALRKYHAGTAAALITALCFVLSHIDLKMWPSALVVGLVASHLRWQSGSLLPSLALNLGFNATLAAAMMSGVMSPAHPLELPIMWHIAGWVVVAALVYMVHQVAQVSHEAEKAREEDE